MYAEIREIPVISSSTDTGVNLLFSQLPISKLRSYEWHMGVYSNISQLSSDHRHYEFDTEWQSNQWSSNAELWQHSVRDTGHDYGEYPRKFPDTPNRPISKPSIPEWNHQPGVYRRHGNLHNGRSRYLLWEWRFRELVRILSMIGRRDEEESECGATPQHIRRRTNRVTVANDKRKGRRDQQVSFCHGGRRQTSNSQSSFSQSRRRELLRALGQEGAVIRAA